MPKRKSTGVSQPGGSAQTSKASRDSAVSQPEASRDSSVSQPAVIEGFRIASKKWRDADCASHGIILSRLQFDHAYGQLKEIFAERHQAREETEDLEPRQHVADEGLERAHRNSRIACRDVLAAVAARVRN